MEMQEWGNIAGAIYYSTGFLVRGKSVWVSSVEPAEGKALPIVKFKVSKRGRWNSHFVGTTANGNFSACLQAIKSPIVGYPEFEGYIEVGGVKTAEIRSGNQPSRILSIKSLTDTILISVDKVSLGREESDIAIEEKTLGVLATIHRRGSDMNFLEQFRAGLGFGQYKRGMFTEVAGVLKGQSLNCLVAALSMYFYSLEPLFNTECPSG